MPNAKWKVVCRRIRIRQQGREVSGKGWGDTNRRTRKRALRAWWPVPLTIAQHALHHRKRRTSNSADGSVGGWAVIPFSCSSFNFQTYSMLAKPIDNPATVLPTTYACSQHLEQWTPWFSQRWTLDMMVWRDGVTRNPYRRVANKFTSIKRRLTGY